jgi:DNA-binding MarR family transcriptional regulator
MLTTPSTSGLAGRMQLVLARTARRLRQEAGAELSPSLSSALASVDRHGPLTPSELASCERVQRPTVTRVVGRLEDMGLVSRSPDPSDGRSSLISVTPEGRALLRRLRTRKSQYLARRLASLEPDDLATLDRAAAILERMLDEDGRR